MTRRWGPPELADELRRAAPEAGVDLDDVVPGASTVLVIEARQGGRGPSPRLGALVEQVAGRLVSQGTPAGRAAVADPVSVDIAVVYDGGDLVEVARETALSVEDVISRHAAGEYRAAFTGFAPGFAYLSGLDPRLWVPRRSEARPSVPAGSVAIADRYSAVYPRSTPGGWRLVGRTDAPVWDPERDPPALLAPGTAVRFHPVRASARAGGGSGAAGGLGLAGGPDLAGGSGAAGTRAAAVPSAPQAAGIAPGAAVLRVVDPGLMTTVQDGGRPGHAHHGVPPSGALDRGSWQLANRLVGNPPEAAALEATVVGPTLRLEAAPGTVRTVAVTGADADVRVSGRSAAVNSPFPMAAGDELRVGPARDGARLYVAVSGGIESEVVLGSRATDQLSGLGHGPLGVGDGLALGAPAPPIGAIDVAPVRSRPQPAELRVLPGPRQDWFTGAAWTALTSATWMVRAESNRVGLRLDGPPLERRRPGELAPEGLVTGSLQVPTSGAPVLFLADHPVTGGYPVLALVAEEDLDRAAQLRAGATVRFVPLTR